MLPIMYGPIKSIIEISRSSYNVSVIVNTPIGVITNAASMATFVKDLLLFHFLLLLVESFNT
ncbi:CPXV170 protein [Cowpox virus]|nr:CPXV170 protein [Cowpox virus]AGY99793.1 CPXV170 protein [Cowpox virus]AGZ00223.1 CPXV170 protein [Cowpox virus]AGZ00854.1 CPXV170 protein [Cowpox virus]AGZ01697.1 CPXV170 protein [Cowpox virus]